VLVVPAAGYAQKATFTGAVISSTRAGAVLPRATVTAVHDASGNAYISGSPYPTFNGDHVFTNQVHHTSQAYQERRLQ
jgi:hypothetical protein